MKSKLTPYADRYRYNVRAYAIPDGIGYNGCGYGWIEVDDAGFAVRMRYANSLTDASSLGQDDQFDRVIDKGATIRTTASSTRAYCVFMRSSAAIMHAFPPSSKAQP